jgi:DNA-binding response OmpR family regulator
MVTTTWRDLDAIRTFAGERWFEAKILPGERHLLRSADVHHYWAEAGERWPPRDPPDVIEVGALRVDLARRVVTVSGREVTLPPQEFAVLAELAARPGLPTTSADLARRVWPDRPGMNGDDVRRLVYRLRRHLGDDRHGDPLIRNRRGYGYVLEGRG